LRYGARVWDVLISAEAEQWLISLTDEEFDAIDGAMDLLATYGPALGRPAVDTIKGSRHPNMKELRLLRRSSPRPVRVRSAATGDRVARRGQGR